VTLKPTNFLVSNDISTSFVTEAYILGYLAFNLLDFILVT